MIRLGARPHPLLPSIRRERRTTLVLVWCTTSLVVVRANALEVMGDRQDAFTHHFNIGQHGHLPHLPPLSSLKEKGSPLRRATKVTIIEPTVHPSIDIHYIEEEGGIQPLQPAATAQSSQRWPIARALSCEVGGPIRSSPHFTG